MRQTSPLLIALILAALPCPANPVTNSSFENLDADAWAVHWEQVGSNVQVARDAHTGQHAVRLSRSREAIEENQLTGLNRGWNAGSGEQGDMLAERKGGIRFRYKGITAGPSSKLVFYVIPMTDEPLEGTGSARAWFEAPAEHVGDGQWHTGMVGYDFTDNDKCRWVQISPRLRGDHPSEWLLDDIEWVEEVGPIPQLVDVRLREMPDSEGQECTIRALIRNAGDAAMSATAKIAFPDGLEVDDSTPAETAVAVGPGLSEAVDWRLLGSRRQPADVIVRAAAGELSASRTLTLAGNARDAWLAADQFVLWPTRETKVAFVVRNSGTCALPPVSASIAVPDELELIGPAQQTLDDCPPGTLGQVVFRVKAKAQTPLCRLRCTWQVEGGEPGELVSEFVVGAVPRLPSEVDIETAHVVCASSEIVFPKNEFGYGIGWVFARPSGSLVGVVPSLGRAVLSGEKPIDIPLYATSFEPIKSASVLGGTSEQRGQGLSFRIVDDQLATAGIEGGITARFIALPASTEGTLGRCITHELSCQAPARGRLLALHGPRLCTGEGPTRDEMEEALFPGVEWLVRGEVSSSDLDIDADHPHRIRRVVHPHMVTIPLMAVRRGNLCAGVLWHARGRWNDAVPRTGLAPDASDTDRLSAEFASPDRFGGHVSDAMGLFAPSTPAYVQPNEVHAATGWPPPASGAGRISLVSAFFVQPESRSVLDAMHAWFDIFGAVPPKELPRTPEQTTVVPPLQSLYRGDSLPDHATAATRTGAWRAPARTAWLSEVAWSMQAYLNTLWDEDEAGWASYVGGPKINLAIGPHPPYVLDCVIASRITTEQALRTELVERVERVRSAHPNAHAAGADMGFLFGNPLQTLDQEAHRVLSTIASQGEDGGWRFRPHVEKGGVFKGRDYAELGADGQEGVGLVARRAANMLRLSRMTGDPRPLEAGLRTLEYIAKFRVPRAAQVWEVPVHTPDILASADACEAFLEAYLITGERSWLDKAVYWQQTGLPFLYQWDVDAFPWMRHGSIPVFGATWFRGSWFGRPVQWNGLRWAWAALRLSEVDTSYPWRMLAAGVTISAMYQQGTDPAAEDFALWPDAISAIDARKARWYFAPSQILKNTYAFLGCEPEPVTHRFETPDGTICINACGRVEGVRLNGGKLGLRLRVPEGLPTHVVFCGITEPEKVVLDDATVERAATSPVSEKPAWAYARPRKMLDVYIPTSGRHIIELQPVRYTPCTIIPEEVTRLTFECDSDEGWYAAHDLSDFTFENGHLLTRATGGDPYMVRSHCRIAGDSVARVRIRMAVSAGEGVQLFWTTADSPAWSEDKSLRAPLINDGDFHDVVFELAAHPLWNGKTITGIRIDPQYGAPAADVRIDWIRGE